MNKSDKQKIKEYKQKDNNIDNGPCLKKSIDEWICTRGKGHKGNHVAWGLSNKIYKVWK